MEFIANEFNIHFIAHESGANQTDIAVMQRSHLIAEVGQTAQSVSIAFQELGISCSGVNA